MFQGHRNQRYVLGPLDRQPYIVYCQVQPASTNYDCLSWWEQRRIQKAEYAVRWHE